MIQNENGNVLTNSQNDLKIIDLSANPAPLGLLGFGMTTVLLNLHNTGLFGLGTMILSMGIFYGGLAQIIAGTMEWKKGNTFGTTAFLSYGLFWFSLVGIIVFPNLGWAPAPDKGAMASYLLMWGIFTGMMFIATLKLNRSLQFIFCSLTILFILLAIGEITSIMLIKQIAGVEGIICGFSAVYTGLAHVMNETYEKAIVPT